jgi:hypothetical protein
MSKFTFNFRFIALFCFAVFHIYCEFAGLQISEYLNRFLSVMGIFYLASILSAFSKTTNNEETEEEK